ncbi:hypothetical protein [Streptomyces parvus]|uniref:hypothetical protein n=1 Tax=Streptomyces parvus TaxID=66428 RepID=UPI003325A598
MDDADEFTPVAALPSELTGLDEIEGIDPDELTERPVMPAESHFRWSASCSETWCCPFCGVWGRHGVGRAGWSFVRGRPGSGRMGFGAAADQRARRVKAGGVPPNIRRHTG